MNSEIFINKSFNVSDIISQEEKKHSNFIKGTINLPDMQKRKKYNVMIYNLKDNTYLLKPIKKYKCLVFEELFGFDYECADFDSEKIIKIKF
tara:strand:+ start:156 stop:431 length:276 start_codon:yes stop_codon:yes gene_type:complete